MPQLSVQTNFCIFVSSYVEGHMKKKNSLEVQVFGLFPGVQKSGRFLEHLLRS